MRMESLPRSIVVVLAAVLAIAVAVVGLATAKTGKTGKTKRGDIASNTQSEILDAGAILVKGARGKIAVRGLDAGGKSLGRLTKTKKVGGKGKASASGTKSPKSASLPLTSSGRSLLAGCSVAKVQSYTAKAGKTGKTKSAPAVASGSTEALNRDLAICSVGSENPAARPYKGPAIPTDNAERCDFLDPAVCLQPWPNDYFTVADNSTDTGRRLNLNPASMPKNRFNQLIDPTDMNRGDGWSPGNKILLKVPEVETPAAFNATGFVPITNLRAYDDDSQPVVVINADTGERHPIWAELDANPTNPDNVNLIVRPARNFDEGARYIVALRLVRNAQGQLVDPPMPFRVYRDRLTTNQGPIESRRPQMESIITTLQQNGIARSNLYMAWDFTVASRQSIADRALEIRDDSLDDLGDSTPGDGVIDGSSPTFTIDTVTENPNANELRRIEGTLTDVPCYLNTDGCPPGSTFAFSSAADRTPNYNPAFTVDVPFRCFIPSSVAAGGVLNPAKSLTYGHGLLGDKGEVTGSAPRGIANAMNANFCAINWGGFSDDDFGEVALAINELSRFNRLADGMVQGMVNQIYLQRAMAHEDGFRDAAAFQVDPDGGDPEPSGSAIEDTDDVFYLGISQGAIMGGALTALSTDMTRSVLNVTGMNYSTLLQRSIDFDEYAQGIQGGEDTPFGLYDAYPNELERQLIISSIQLMWDRGEANGYAHHATSDPLPNTPAHQILLQVAMGDHQVAPVTAEVEARTIGARVHTPAFDPGRHWEANPFMQIPAISGYPYGGSALVLYDGGPLGYSNMGSECSHGNPSTDPCDGTAVPPNGNVPNRTGDDPHSYVRRAADGIMHIDSFLQNNGFIDQCESPGLDPEPCYSNNYPGP